MLRAWLPGLDGVPLGSVDTDVTLLEGDLQLAEVPARLTGDLPCRINLVIFHETFTKQLARFVESQLSLGDIEVHHDAATRLHIQLQHLVNDCVGLVLAPLLGALAHRLWRQAIMPAVTAATDGVVKGTFSRQIQIRLGARDRLTGAIKRDAPIDRLLPLRRLGDDLLRRFVTVGRRLAGVGRRRLNV